MKTRNRILLGACAAALPLGAFATVALAGNAGCSGRADTPARAAVMAFAPAGQARFMPAVELQGLRMIAAMQASMQRMAAEMNALMAAPFWGPSPGQMIHAAFGPHPWAAAPGSSVMVTTISTGSGTCSETISYSYPAHSRGRPIVKVSKVGNACGAIHLSAPGLTPAAASVPPPVAAPAPAPLPAAHRPDLITADYRAPITLPRVAAPHT